MYFLKASQFVANALLTVVHYFYYINLNTSLFRANEIYHHRIENRTYHCQQIDHEDKPYCQSSQRSKFLTIKRIVLKSCQGTNSNTLAFNIV